MNYKKIAELISTSKKKTPEVRDFKRLEKGVSGS
jgi:hypothetical protein